ncbi:XRE family transcriptional regulator [Acinetobacter sp. Marseille-Q1618]|uniref:XRE family transcriptional regulator n=1 Tax=Acinetobacter sp. Marseille-Q1618 TaxID=2697502 RepID=UPI00156DCE30|nr:XRE family transcriptional regulator [Acinetobacter sp. Marseille-Q1618]
MSINIEQYRSPGQLIHSLLEDKGWNGRVLSGILKIDESGVNRLLQDKKSVNAQLAIVLEDIFGIPAENFLTLQMKYDLAKARIKDIPDPERQSRVKLFGNLPIAEMINRGWLDVENKKDFQKIEKELLKFFKVNSLDDIETNLLHSAKKTNELDKPTQIQLAWVNRVKRIAEEMIVAPYLASSAQKAIDELKSLLWSAEEIRKVPRILAENGIRFVLVEPLKGSKMDGVCMWLDQTYPVIGMSLRFDRIDNFWFVLRHELEHVLQGHGKSHIKIDYDLKQLDMDDEEEKIANLAASTFAISEQKLNSFIARKSPFFAEIDIIGFSNTHRIHPGILAGKLQHYTQKYNLFRKHLVSIRNIVIPSAMSDGWGNVYPLDD